MCLKGLSPVPAVTVGLGIEQAWAVQLDSALRHHWVQAGLISVVLPLLLLLPETHCGQPLSLALWGNGPLVPLDEDLLMAVSLKTDRVV